MFKIDIESMTIYLTKGDSAAIIFSAKTKAGENFHPTRSDRLTFSAAKKIEDDPLIEIVNEMGEDELAFWTIQLEPHHTKNLKAQKYNFDVQLEMIDSQTGELQGVKTIIGKTDEVTPTLVLWGDISPEGDINE